MSLAALTALGANAQAVLGYSLTQSTETYTPLTGATVIYDGSAAENADINAAFCDYLLSADGLTQEQGTYTGFPTGVDIDFCGTTVNTFAVEGGYLWLGNGQVAADPRSNAFWVDNGMQLGICSNFGVSATTDTRVSYQTLGEGDDARLVVQFEKLGVRDGMWDETGQPLDLQIMIYKDGAMKLCMTGFDVLPEEVELRFWSFVKYDDNYVCAAENDGVYTLDHNSNNYIYYTSATPNGFTFTFNAPEPCVVPISGATALTLDPTSLEINGSFTASESADNYLVLYAEGAGAAMPAAPVNGTVYTDEVYSEGYKLVQFGPETTFRIVAEGGKDYTFFVYAANAYGSNGPVYNTTDVLTGSVKTLPGAPAEVKVVDSSLNSLTLSVAANSANDDVVILYNDFCDRDVYGDHGLFVTPGADAKVGDELPVPEGYVPEFSYEGSPEPKNAGTVAYIGKAGEAIVIEGLNSNTAYYIDVYSRNADGVYSSEVARSGGSTYLEFPYDGDTYNWPRYDKPFGWNVTEDNSEAHTLGVQNDSEFDNWGEEPIRRGTNGIQQTARLQTGDANNGWTAWMVPAPVVVSERHQLAKFDYSITFGESRWSNIPYNDWDERDELKVQVSEDGETWADVAVYTKENRPEQETESSYVSIAADLNDYRDKTVQVRLYWHTYMLPVFGGQLYIDRFSLGQAVFPEVPEVTVSKVTYDGAQINWVSTQENYELEYGKKDGEKTVVNVENAMTYTLTGLDVLTEYEVRVRGILADGFSDWSDVVSFTTLDWPEVAAPVNLVSNVDEFADKNIVTLSWDVTEEMESYQVQYRLTSATEWETVECNENKLVVENLEAEKTYIWKVLAYCTHDRVTEFSAQARFTTPESAGIGAVNADGVSVNAGDGNVVVRGAEGMPVAVYTMAGERVAADAKAAADCDYSLKAGVYMVTVGNKAYKVIVK